MTAAAQLDLFLEPSTRDGVLRALSAGPLLVREVWQLLGVTEPEDTARVADALTELAREGRVRCEIETMRWEVTGG